MERDFLAAIGKDPQQQQQPDKGGSSSREESVYFGGGAAAAAAEPAMDWSFGSKPALMSFRSAARDEQPSFPHFSAFDAARTPASRALTHQRSFGADSHGSPQYSAMHRAQQPAPQHALNGARAVPVSSPFNQSNPTMFRVQGSPSLPNGALFKQPPFAMTTGVPSSTVGAYGTTRDAPKPKTAQLTIFYAGSVNVFDNVPAEKAQELMFLASRGSLPSSTPVAHRPEAPIFAPTKMTVPEASPAKHMIFQKPQQRVSPPASSTSKPIIMQPAGLPRSASSSNMDCTVPKSTSPLVVPPISQAPLAVPPLSQAPLVVPPISQAPLAVAPISQAPFSQQETRAVTTAAAIMPRAVPQARKASLARFLEKRKERVSVAPYPTTKMESSDTYGSTSANEKSSCTDIALSSNRDESLCLGQPMNISFSQESPSTKLQI